MVTIEFHYRSSARYKDRGKIFIRLIHQRRSGSLTLPWSVSPDDWESMSVRLKMNQPQTQIEFKLLREKQVLQGIIDDLSVKGNFTVADVLSLYRCRQLKKGLSGLVAILSDELIVQGKERTALAYRTTFRMLLVFTGKSDLEPEKLTSVLLESYQSYMQTNRKSLNTISFYMRNLRAIYNKGIKRGYIQPVVGNPFQNVYTKVAPTRKRALPKEAVSKLKSLVKDTNSSLNEEERKALFLFLFSFHSRGMCFVDMAYLKKADVHKGMIRYYRKKTGQYMEIRITRTMRSYMESLAGDNCSKYLFQLIPADNRSPYLQYCSSLRKQNRLLNQIGRKVGLKQPLTSHMARHSWATVAKSEQIPIEVISEALGHSRLDTTYRYLDSFGESILDKANRKVSKAVEKL